MPRSRRSRGAWRRRRSRRRRVSPLTVVATLLVLAGLMVVGADAFGPSLTPHGRGGGGGDGRAGGDDRASNVRTIQRLGGKVGYGSIDPRTGQRSGITATITPRMVAAASRDQLGSEPDESIRPPGFEQLPSRNRSRGHLLGRQLGGSGEVASNLVALFQSRANSPVMRDYETMVADAVRSGETVDYEVRPLYASGADRGAPEAVRIRATGSRGFRLDVEVANTPQAAVKVFVAPPAG